MARSIEYRRDDEGRLLVYVDGEHAGRIETTGSDVVREDRTEKPSSEDEGMRFE